jgi:GLPGLI family protein
MNTVLKSVLCFILAIFLSCYSCYSQEKARYKCAYQLDMLKDTLAMDYWRQEIYIVQIGDKLTKGFTYQKFYNDSLKKASPDLYRTLFSASVKESIEEMRRTGDLTSVRNNSFTPGAFTSDIYKDYKKKEIRVKDNVYVFNFIYTDDLKPQDWEILGDTLTILGYHCQKAQCHFRGRDFEAWFTPEIPISEGPWKFYGLPGLITKLHDVNKHYSFELIGFQESNDPIDTKISGDTKKITRKEFYDKALREKIDAVNRADGISVGIANYQPIVHHYDPIERDYK